MGTLDQERAKLAFTHVTAVNGLEKAKQERYASLVYGMPALLRSAGLSQALHFVRSRSKNKSDDGPRLLLEHLAEQIARVDAASKGGDQLLSRVREADLCDYLRLTQETLACVDWYRRFVQGVLGIEVGKHDDDA